MPGQNPTRDQIFAHWRDCLDYVEERDRHGNVNAPNVYGLYSDVLNTGGGEFMNAAHRVLDADRVAAGGILTPNQLRALFEPHIVELLRVYDLPLVGSYEDRLFRLIEQLEVDGRTFNSREITYGAPTFAGAVGNGLIRRCTVDRFNNNLEGVGAEAKRATCLRDQTSGARRHREVFRFEGTAPARDSLLWTGSGLDAEIAAVDAASSGILRNPSFETNGQTADSSTPASTTAVTGWVLSAAASFRLRNLAALVYRGFQGQPTTLWSLEFFANGTATQTLLTESPALAFDPNRPYHLQVAWMRRAGATGNLNLRIGGLTATVAIGTGVNDVYNLLIMPLGQNSWYRQFGAQSMTVQLEVDTLAVGTVIVDSVELNPMVNVDGSYYLPVGGSTPFQQDDRATWTDLEIAARARFCYWLWRSLLGDDGAYAPDRHQKMGGVWLPTALAGAENVAD